MIMSKTPDDDLYCKECQSVNVREVSRKKYLIGEREEMEKIEVFVICEICKTHSVCVIILAKEEESELRTFPSGATRSRDADCERYDLIPPSAVRREAIIMAEGAETHGDRNWEQGVPIHVCLNHLERHLNLYKSGDRSEDHLAKIRVNAGFIIHFEEKDNDRISNSELIGSNYPDSPRATPLHSHRQTHLDGSLPNAIEEG